MLPPHHYVLTKELLEKQLDHIITKEELEQLNELVDDYSDDDLGPVLSELVAEKNYARREEDTEENPDAATRRILSLAKQKQVVKAPRFIHMFRYMVAAMMVALGIGLWFWLQRSAQNQSMANLPCGLKLPTHRQEGEVVKIAMVHDKITFAIPRSWQYTLTLPDSSKVWLNAESSITYPRSFTGDTREVAITGEAYFDVNNNSERAFYVTSKGKRIKATGSLFNVNAYDQQVIVSTGKASWREGYFAFEKAGVISAVNEMARWYDWDVQYSNPRELETLTTYFCRNTPESDALETLRANNIPFYKQGNKITIL